jgi:hypothetical protein
MPLHLLLATSAMTLGLPLLILLAIVNSNFGVSYSVFNNALAIIVLSTFLMLMVFEIKRISELPPGSY